VGLIEPHLNGTIVGDEVLAPGWTSYRHRLVVSSHDVTGRVVLGRNALGAVLGEGWAVGRLGWEDKRHHYADRPAAWLQLELAHDDGTVDVIATDTSFRAGRGGVRANSLYDGETFDARLEPHGWDRAGFDDRDWSGTERFDWPLDTLVEPIAPPIRRIEQLAPVEIIRTPSRRTVVDFGQVISGWVRLTVTGERGRSIAADPNAWRMFIDAFDSHYPGVPLDGTSPEAAAMSVRTLLDYLPGASQALTGDLECALGAASNPTNS
jgi:alpha-L-rhamnosidase